MNKIKKLHKQVQSIRKEGIWNSIKGFILTSPIVSFVISALLLLLGAYTAAIINFVSSTGDALTKYITSFTLCIILLLVGFLFFFDFWHFRKKYSFIENQTVIIAEKLISIHERALRTLTLVDGINAIQCFQVERHTDDNHLLFKFIPTFSLTSRYFKISRFKGKEIEVPIALFEWLGSSQKKSVPDYGVQINNLIYEWLMTQYENTQDKQYEDLIKAWDGDLDPIPKKISSIHYHVLFETREILYNEDIPDAHILDYVQKMNYNGIKSNHSNRQYCTLRFMLNSDYGSVEYLMLIIANKKLVDDTTLEYILKRILT